MKSENNFVLGYDPNTNVFVDSCCGGGHGSHGNGHGHHGNGHSFSNSGHGNHGGGSMSGDKYQCPMKCEGDKTYDQSGNCPVCNMKLVPAGEGHHHHH